MSVRTFHAPTRIVAGTGSLAELDAELAPLPRPVAVIADRGVADAGLLAQILEHVAPERIGATVLVDPNPDIAAVDAAGDLARAAGCASVLGIGGGSGLGMAKAVAILLTNTGPITRYEGVDRVPRLPAPILAVPTTAGSGSEVSNALVLHEPGRPREIIVRGAGCEPRTAILDAAVLRGLARLPMLYAGLDALTHTLESLWARGAMVFTEALASRAARDIIETLPIAVDGISGGTAARLNADGSNDEVLQRLLEASTAANLACGNSGLGLVHALSSSVRVPLAHGLQNGVLLPRVAELNRHAVSPSTLDLIDQLPQLYRALGFDPRFDSATVSDDLLDSMIDASSGHPFRANNRLDFDDDRLRRMLTQTVGAENTPTTKEARI